MVFIIIAASGPFSWLLTSLGAIGDLESWLLSLTDSPIIFILAVILFIFLLGTVMDSAVNIIIVGPVLVNVMAQAGFPEVQAAIVVIVGFLIGSVTPPVGVAYFYCCNNSTSASRKGSCCVNSISGWIIFTFIFYPRNSRVNYVSSKLNEWLIIC
jgi:TRAP-type C4-dicarboxylate transport system permease large subunit